MDKIAWAKGFTAEDMAKALSAGRRAPITVHHGWLASWDPPDDADDDAEHHQPEEVLFRVPDLLPALVAVAEHGRYRHPHPYPPMAQRAAGRMLALLREAGLIRYKKAARRWEVTPCASAS